MNNQSIPKVSVVIPVYNVEKYLAECLESVLNQSLSDIEILCIDDCSTDTSLKILKHYANNDNRISVLRNLKNNGPSYSRNRGLKKANGQYVYFLDSDDMITKLSLETLYNKAEKEKADIIYFDAELIYETEALSEKHNDYKTEHLKIYDGVYKGENLFTKFIVNNDWTPSPPRQFFNANFLKKNKITYYDGIVHEDHLFWFITMLKAERAICIYDKFFIRRYRENSIMTVQLSSKNFEGMFICYYEMILFWKHCKLEKETNLAVELYLKIILDAAKSMYNDLVNSYGKVELKTNDVIIQYLFKILIYSNYNKIKMNIDEEKLRYIQEYPKVIIYGAGLVARDVLSILDKNNIGIFGFAVSGKSGNQDYLLGNKVYKIDELVQYRMESVVLIATTPKYYDNILKLLNSLHFNNVIFAIDTEEYDYSNITGS